MIRRSTPALLLLAVSYAQGSSAQDLAAFAATHLPTGMELAHPAVAGAFGPAGKHVVLLYRPANDDGEFQGAVYLNGGDKALELPEIGLIPNQFAIEVKAVFFEKLPGAATPDLLVLYGYHRNGSEADDGNACLIYRWKNGAFARVPDAEKKVVNLATAAAIRKRLRPATGGTSK